MSGEFTIRQKGRPLAETYNTQQLVFWMKIGYISDTAFECNDRALQKNGRPSVVPLAAQECSVHVLDVNESPWQWLFHGYSREDFIVTLFTVHKGLKLFKWTYYRFCNVKNQIK